MKFEAKIRLVANMQHEYEKLLSSRKLTKKAMCDLCVPVRDALNISDSEILRIARKEMTLYEIVKLIDSKTVKVPRGQHHLNDAEYELLVKLAKITGMDCWFTLAASGPTMYVYDLEDKRELSLSNGVKLLLEGVSNEVVQTLEECEKNALRGLCERLSINTNDLI